METIKMNMNRVQMALSQPIDPRIDSPQIKVVYPTPPVVLKDLPADEPTLHTSTPTQPTASSQQETPVGQTTGTVPEKGTDPAPATSWQDTIKQNPMLFIIIGILGLGIGFMLGKNKG